MERDLIFNYFVSEEHKDVYLLSFLWLILERLCASLLTSHFEILRNYPIKFSFGRSVFETPRFV